ncbi:MAG: hypothetical protein HZA61_02770 [Candidatus Eisenbacteria bacterium]|uniref:Endo-1,3-beta-glucanase btgC n=1 Tax=Eiseniibacteriota bacterium TaxID=2212470 RepID=A0A933W218_UNCEI|nr:hypothetical protein [Candidatus Eisenbacteria bacterium]
MSPRVMPLSLALALAALVVLGAGAVVLARTTRTRPFPRQQPFVVRPLALESGGRWIGDAVAYGPHRDGQRPRGVEPTVAQVREDLRLLSKDWHLLRIYGAIGTGDTVLRAIREEKCGTKVVLGLWLDAEERRDSTGRVVERFPKARAANRRDVERAIQHARHHPDLVAAITVGNETQVYWSANRLPAETVIAYIREVRARTRVPVSTADDFNFWNKAESRAIAAECDFVFTHLHPLWNGQQLEEALPWIERNLAEIRAVHPDREVVIGETGWATMHNDQGDQGKLMKGAVGEREQAEFYRALRAWIARTRVPTFVFEAFDENWKGSPDPAEVEKHWGLYRADRTPKLAMQREENR